LVALPTALACTLRGANNTVAPVTLTRVGINNCRVITTPATTTLSFRRVASFAVAA